MSYMVELSNEAKASDAGKAFIAAGFEIEWTGGGCMAWQKMTHNCYVWATNSEGSSLTLDPNDPNDHWTVGLYSGDEPDTRNEFTGTADVAEAITAANALLISYEFSRNLLTQIGQVGLGKAVRKNAGEYAGTDVCATHDYCDANMPMNAAFTHVLKREFDFGSDADAELWNRAWGLAKAAEFYRGIAW